MRSVIDNGAVRAIFDIALPDRPVASSLDCQNLSPDDKGVIVTVAPEIALLSPRCAAIYYWGAWSYDLFEACGLGF